MPFAKRLKNIKMKNKIIKHFFLAGMVLSAWFLWWSIGSLIKTSITENWFYPIIFFSLFFVTLSLATILTENKRKLFLFGGLAILGGVFFADNKITYLLVAMIAMTLLFLGMQIVRKEMAERIKINIWSNLRFGRKLFVLAVTVIIAIGFLSTPLLSGDKKSLPKIGISEKQVRLISKVMTTFNSDIKGEELEEMTIDEYILKIQIKNGDSSLLEKTLALDPSYKVAILTAGRESVGKLAGRTVDGEEKILSIFSEIINNKINDYFNVNVEYGDYTIALAPWLFIALAFLTIFSIGMFISPLLILIVRIMLALLVAVGILKIEKKETKMEIIV